MTIITTTPDQRPVGLYSTDEVVLSSLTVDGSTDTGKMLMRLVIDPTIPGDVLRVDARVRVTSELPYAVGIGGHVMCYDVDDGQPWPHDPWVEIGPLAGDNDFQPRHHMPLSTSAVYRVPADWPAGHRMVVLIQVDAHSTAWQAGDTVAVDQEYGLLVVERWA